MCACCLFAELSLRCFRPMEGGKDRMTADGSGEVFSKQKLSSSLSGGERKSKSKLKRRSSRHSQRQKYSTSAASTSSGGSGAVQKIKSISDLRLLDTSAMEDQENKPLSTLITRSRVSQKVGIYKKAKCSDTVTRKPLHPIELSERTENAAKKDLRRVLGQASSPATSAITTGIGVVGKGGKGEEEREGGASCPVLVPSMTQGCRDRHSSAGESRMQCSPPSCSAGGLLAGLSHASSTGHWSAKVEEGGVPLRALSLRIAQGLQPKWVFQQSDNYLSSLKDDIRRVMRQSNSEMYKHLRQWMLEGKSLKSPVYSTLSSSSSNVVYLEPHSTSSPAHSLLTSFTDLPPPPASLLPPPLPPSSPTPCYLTGSPMFLDVGSEGAELDIQQALGQAPHTSHSSPPPRMALDILDLVDCAGHAPDSSAHVNMVRLQPSPLSPTPSRPKMHPHRLY